MTRGRGVACGCHNDLYDSRMLSIGRLTNSGNTFPDQDHYQKSSVGNVLSRKEYQ